MARLLLLSFVSSCVALVVGNTAARAATYQVGPTRTWTQIGQAMATVGPGDVVEVDGNATYSAVRWTKSGSAAQPIRLRGVPAAGMRPLIRGGTNTVEIEADHVVMEGFDISGGSSRCFFHHGDAITLRDSVVHDCAAHGILGADTDSGSLLLEYVEVHHCGSGTQYHQIYMATDEVAHAGSVFRMQYCYVHDATGGNSVKSRAERNEIYFNWIEGAQYHELELIGPDPNGAPANWSVDLKREDSDVVGNVLRKTSTSFVARIGGDATGWSKGRYRFVNNTIITTTGSGAVFRLFDELESVEMHNNVIVTSGSGAPNVLRAATDEFTWVNGEHLVGSNNWVMTGATNVPTQWTGTVTGASPGLTNLSDDPRPVAGSPVLGAGNASPAGPAGFPFPSPLWPPGFHPPTRALIAAGTAMARPSDAAIDIGAFELGSVTAGTGGRGGAGGGSGAGGASGGGGGRGGAGGTTAGGASGRGGATAGAGGTSAGAGGAAAGASGRGGATAGAGGRGGATAGAGGTPRAGAGGAVAGAGGGGSSGRGGATTAGTGGALAGNAGTGGGDPPAPGGCSCDIAGGPSPLALFACVAFMAGALRRRRRSGSGARR